MQTRAILSVMAVGMMGSSALAQFGTAGSTPVREKLIGKLLSADGAPTVASNDQLGVFFKNSLVGSVTFPDTKTDFAVTIFGDDPATTPVEGPKIGEKVDFRFYDSSANAIRTDLRVENTDGEAFNYRYAGEAAVLPGGLPIPIDLTPTRFLNVRIGATDSPGPGGPGDDRDKFDVDGNGKINAADAAMVLRLVLGARRGLSDDQIDAADVNGDTRVDTQDAIEILRNR